MKKLILTMFLLYSCLYGSDSLSTSLSKEDKVLYSNIAIGAGIVGWGVAYWDYGSGTPHMESEGWFGQDTKNGGADKFGHFYTNYLLSHALAGTYEHWGYSSDEAIKLAAISSFGLSGLIMEVGDSFSPYGMSLEDLAMDLLGSVVGYYWYKYPYLMEKIDFRIEFLPKFNNNSTTDVMTDYHRMKHLIAIKAEGFDFLKKNSFTKYLELHIGYYTKGYQDLDLQNERHSYIGVGINLSKLFRKPLKNYSKIFNYYQVPNTYIKNK